MSWELFSKQYIYFRKTSGQGRSQTFLFGGAIGGASFATRGAVNGLCLIALNNFNAVAWRHAENFGGATGRARQNFGEAVAPLAPPSSAPASGSNVGWRTCFMLQAPTNLVTPLHDAHHDCLAKMAKFVYINTCPSVANYQSQNFWNWILLTAEVVWP